MILKMECWHDCHNQPSRPDSYCHKRAGEADDLHRWRGKRATSCSFALGGGSQLHRGSGWEQAWRTWLHARQLDLQKILLEDGKLKGDDLGRCAGKLCVLRGTSPRGDHGHVVVARVKADGEFELLHDPFPDAASPMLRPPFVWAAMMLPQ
ncbi:unnamed protein product [Durusdinium trenchii]|uniref:Uncharacterized protein n=1 Tax=Durusdinium trenchii TaxID=1381693 RepID=A0ABP0RVT1_9DINO